MLHIAGCDRLQSFEGAEDMTTLVSVIAVAIGALALTACATSDDSAGGSSAFPAPPDVTINEADNIATVRFPGGCEVRFGPARTITKYSSFCTERERVAAHRAYVAAVEERASGPKD